MGTALGTQPGWGNVRRPLVEARGGEGKRRRQEPSTRRLHMCSGGRCGSAVPGMRGADATLCSPAFALCVCRRADRLDGLLSSSNNSSTRQPPNTVAVPNVRRPPTSGRERVIVRQKRLARKDAEKSIPHRLPPWPAVWLGCVIGLAPPNGIDEDGMGISGSRRKGQIVDAASPLPSPPPHRIVRSREDGALGVTSWSCGSQLIGGGGHCI